MSLSGNVSQVTTKAEQLDKSGSGCVHYVASQEKNFTNHVNLTCELRNGVELSDCNKASIQAKIGDASQLSSDSKLVEDTDKHTQHGHMASKSLCITGCQGTLCEPSEQENLIACEDMQNGAVTCCLVATECRSIEQPKKSLIPGKIAAEAAGQSSKVLDETVPDQSVKISSTEVSEINQSGECTSGSQHNFAARFTEASNSHVKDQVGASSQDVVAPPQGDRPENAIGLVQIVLGLQSASVASVRKQSGVKHNSTCEEYGPDGSKSSRRSGRSYRKTPETKVKSEYKLRDPESRRKDPGSSGQEIAAASEPNINLANGSVAKKRGRKKGQKNSNQRDEYSRMRMHIRYQLHKMSYEQNLIDAYSSEGWRGQSLEKLRPEGELQRAKLNINRIKLKIRALFQRLDAMCAEGKFPESLFDEEGLIDSEDIFCAKCGFKELSRDNDIILCDGACERGFHQKCLDPPLRTEEIPPGDEGWFCPACDCKFDCVELLNDSLEAKISISDNWENIFPEAAKTGGEQDDISGLPSDDSEDDDFDPDEKEHDRMEEDGPASGESSSGESSSDESDFSSASEDLGAIIHNDKDQQQLGLPSDDSEDDDFNPNLGDAEEQGGQEASSSDFTSASEDLNAAINKDEIPSEDECPVSPPRVVEDGDESVTVSGRRQAQRLDYKKLYDETYGNASTDSSDDEDWRGSTTPKQRKQGRRKNSLSEDEELKDSVKPKRMKHDHTNASSTGTNCDIPAGSDDECSNTNTTGKVPLNPQVGVSNGLQTPETSSGGQKSKRQPYKKLGDAVTQRLHTSFKENQYPNRSEKEKLAGELAISAKQVSKWFENARWCSRHSTEAVKKNEAHEGSDTTPRKDINPVVGETSANKNSGQSGRRKHKRN